MTTTPALRDLGDEDFVQLTTFRRSGAPVSTPVWVVRDGDALVVTTPSQSGKIKRLHHKDDVELRPCSRRGTVKPGTAWVPATARLDPDLGAHDGFGHLFAAKYGWEYRVAMLVEQTIRRFRPMVGPDRRIVRITEG